MRETVSFRGRDGAVLHCACGGTYDESGVTEEEERQYGCRRESGCCVAAWLCGGCGRRIVVELDAPEWRD